MGEKMKLKVKALRILQADLHRDEMVAIYLMQFGTDLPPNLAKHLTKIVRLLCKKLDWIDDKCDPPGPSINYFSVLFLKHSSSTAQRYSELKTKISGGIRRH